MPQEWVLNIQEFKQYPQVENEYIVSISASIRFLLNWSSKATLFVLTLVGAQERAVNRD